MEQPNISLRVLSHFYYSMGFNLTCISNIENDYNYFNVAPLKAPAHKWEHLITCRQTLKELTEYDWETATGIGCVLGYSNLRCIDIDGITDFSITKEILRILNLPKDYEWVFLTGSGKGIHIYIRTEQHHFVINNGQTKAFHPNKKNKDKFKVLELRWKYHCVLPPSLHKSYNNYKFTKKLPLSPPKEVDLGYVNQMIYEICDHNLQREAEYINSQSKIYYLNTSAVEIYENEIDTAKEVQRKFLIFDTETNGTPFDWSLPPDDSNNWPKLIQIAWYIFGENANFISKKVILIKPEGFVISPEISKLTKITQEDAIANGVSLKNALYDFLYTANNVDYVIAHNFEFDVNVITSECLRTNLNSLNNLLKTVDFQKKKICTMTSTTSFCNLPRSKYPKLAELYEKLFNEKVTIDHDALSDAKITAKCFWELLWKQIIQIPSKHE